ncbi:MAG TPA: hypothetical protein VGJ91_00225 [Polyangiaceae bacterium]
MRRAHAPPKVKTAYLNRDMNYRVEKFQAIVMFGSRVYASVRS